MIESGAPPDVTTPAASPSMVDSLVPYDVVGETGANLQRKLNDLFSLAKTYGFDRNLDLDRVAMNSDRYSHDELVDLIDFLETTIRRYDADLALSIVLPAPDTSDPLSTVMPLDACVQCWYGQTPHREWHYTRATALEIGKEFTRRERERERDEIIRLPDDLLIAYGADRRRSLALAEAGEFLDWPQWASDLHRESLRIAEDEYRRRQRAAQLGADAVARSDAGWTERIELVKQQTDLRSLIGSDCGGVRDRGGTRFTCKCPFHDDRNPSLDVDTEKRRWRCWACGFGGDAIEYVKRRYGLMFGEAIKYLEQLAGIEPPKRTIRGIKLVRPDSDA